jgi:hypothetical protein
MGKYFGTSHVYLAIWCYAIAILGTSCNEKPLTPEQLERLLQSKDTTSVQEKPVVKTKVKPEFNGGTFESSFVEIKGHKSKKKVVIILRDSSITIGTRTLVVSKKSNGIVYAYDEGIDGEIESYVIVLGDGYVSIGNTTFYSELPMRQYTIRKGDTRKVLIKKGIPSKFITKTPQVGDTIYYE